MSIFDENEIKAEAERLKRGWVRPTLVISNRRVPKPPSLAEFFDTAKAQLDGAATAVRKTLATFPDRDLATLEERISERYPATATTHLLAEIVSDEIEEREEKRGALA